MEKLETLNGFQQKIYIYIRDYHPYMLDDEEEAKAVIVMRAQNAEKAYQDADIRGESPFECEAAAWQALYAGLEFSPVTYLIETCLDLTGYEMNNDEACEIYRNQAVKDIFLRYGTEIEGDAREEFLIQELKPFLQKHESKQKVKS